MSLNKYIKDFPILNTQAGGKPLYYLDNAATTQKPTAVIEAVNNYYYACNANPHRGNYELSVKATEMYEHSRETVRSFINAKSAEEIIFTKNTTEAINLIAYCYGLTFINEGDEIVLSVSEHHSNLIPWQMVAKARGAVLKYMYVDSDGRLPETEIEDKIGPKTKLVAFAQISNVLGTVNPVKDIVKKAHSVGAITIVDCAQSVPHMEVDVQSLDADFIAFSGHKMFAPMGIGVLYGKKELLDKMPPFLSGGEMIEYVYEQSATYAELPYKFEAGTQNVGGAVGLEAAISYIKSVGFEKIRDIESELMEYAYSKMSELPFITIYGGGEKGRSGVIAFNVTDVHPHDVASILDADGVAIRAGHHCAQPLMRFLGLNSTCRVSFSIYNTREDIDAFIDSLKKVRRVMRLES
jgi:cysteine desulfurase/selenocysteine lyase